MNKVSVIMPAYNAEKFIDEAIRSVIGQIYSNWDLTIVNDGSTDNTKKIICKYVMDYPEKIRLIDKKKNEGTARGLNTLIDAVDGDYICWLSADDVYVSNMLEESVSFLENNREYDLVFSNYETIDENSKLLRNAPYNNCIEELKKGSLYQPYNYLLTTGCCIHGCTVMLKKHCFDGELRFNHYYRYAHDYDFWLRMASQYRVGYIDAIHVKGREYSSQISMQGHNEIDAIHVLIDFINGNKFEALYRKAGYSDKTDAIQNVIIGQLKKYKHRENEFQELLSILLSGNVKVINSFWKLEEKKDLYNIVKWMKVGKWPCNESFFYDDSKDSYLSLLCDIANVDVFLINNQAIRFDRFTGNSIDRFNEGLMRSNDIVVGSVNSDKLKLFLEKSINDYRFCFVSKIEGKLRIGFTYYMYQMMNIHDILEMEDVQVTDYDIWWSLSEKIYKDKILKGDV